jgi:hypothetical protein
MNKDNYLVLYLLILLTSINWGTLFLSAKFYNSAEAITKSFLLSFLYHIIIVVTEFTSWMILIKKDYSIVGDQFYDTSSISLTGLFLASLFWLIMLAINIFFISNLSKLFNK